MSTHANMVKMTVTSVGADPYTITLNAASSGFQSFADAYGANATVDILITQGTVWEVARNCTYTHSGTTVTRGTFEDSSTGSRITTFDNTAVVSVVATADSGRRWDSAALTWLAATVTTGNVTGVVGTMHGLDISGLTAARDFVLPTTAATGDRIGVFCTTDAAATAANVLQIKSGAAGDLINGTDHSSTIWSALLIKGECLIFRCIAGSTVDWVVEYDGRIPQVARMSLTSDITTNTAGSWKETDFNQTDIAIGCVVSTAGAGTSTITVRRANSYILSGGMAAKSGGSVAAADLVSLMATKNGNASTGTSVGYASTRAASTSPPALSFSSAATLAAGDVVQHNFYWQSADVGLRGLTYASFLFLSEVL